MSRFMVVAAFVGMSALGGCAHYNAENKPLVQYPGIQDQIQNFYDSNAIEEDWSCDQPQLDVIDKSNIVSQTPTQVRMAVNYYFTSGDMENRRGGDGCQGFNTRYFTFAKGPDGGLSLTGMSGAQRGGGV